MSAQRLYWAAGALFTLASVGVVAFADPDASVPGTYSLTGTQGSKATRVNLVVANTGAVTRNVTFADGTSGGSLSATGTFTDPRTLRVTFQTTGGTAGQPVPDPTNLRGYNWTLRGTNTSGAYTGRGSFTGNNTIGWTGLFTYRYDGTSSQGSMMLRGKLQGNTFVGRRIRTTGISGWLGGTPPANAGVPVSYNLAADGKDLGGNYGTANRESMTRPTVPTKPGTPGTGGAILGVYTFDGQGGCSGNLTNSTGTGDWTSASESGRKADEVQVKILAPANGTGLLAGQVLDVRVQPDNATWDVVSGPGRKTVTNKLQVTGDGAIVLAAKLADKTSDPVTVNSVKPEVCELEVQNTQALSDAQPPHMKRALGAAATDKPEQQPAAILIGEKLTVKVTLKAAADLGVAARVKLVATGANNVRLEGEGEVASLKNGASVTVASAAAFASKVDVAKLTLDFALEQEGASSVTIGSQLPLRVYVCFKPSIRNGPYYGEASRPIPTKDHVEKTCTWAAGTSKNVGNGGDSICYKLDNLNRHHVHPVDFKPARMPFTSAYPLTGSTPPINYGDLDGASQARSSGERGEGQIYYPPLEVSNPAKEDYSHYASNFGWWVFDNPTHTGGRCNQQASLMADLFGTQGIQARVHYLHRVGVSKAGRPVRQYFNSSQGGQYWNFHGLAAAVMQDGTEWLYDGSFSWAPNRKNGLKEWAEAPGRWLNQSTPFIYEFGPWYYEDWMGGRVPGDQIPTTYVADNPQRGQYYGVRAAANEDLNWYNKSHP